MTPTAFNVSLTIVVSLALLVIFIYTPRPPRPKGT